MFLAGREKINEEFRKNLNVTDHAAVEEVSFFNVCIISSNCIYMQGNITMHNS